MLKAMYPIVDKSFGIYNGQSMHKMAYQKSTMMRVFKTNSPVMARIHV